MTCQTDQCERRAQPDWALCIGCAASLLTAAFGEPDAPLRGRPDSALPRRDGLASEQVAGSRLARQSVA